MQNPEFSAHGSGLCMGVTLSDVRPELVHRVLVNPSAANNGVGISSKYHRKANGTRSGAIQRCHRHYIDDAWAELLVGTVGIARLPL